MNTDSRKAFEAWLHSLPPKPDLSLTFGGRYRNRQVESRWLGWQAATDHQIRRDAEIAIDVIDKAEKGVFDAGIVLGAAYCKVEILKQLPTQELPTR